jgi:hypothetical protein
LQANRQAERQQQRAGLLPMEERRQLMTARARGQQVSPQQLRAANQVNAGEPMSQAQWAMLFGPEALAYSPEAMAMQEGIGRMQAAAAAQTPEAATAILGGADGVFPSMGTPENTTLRQQLDAAQVTGASPEAIAQQGIASGQLSPEDIDAEINNILRSSQDEGWDVASGRWRQPEFHSPLNAMSRYFFGSEGPDGYEQRIEDFLASKPEGMEQRAYEHAKRRLEMLLAMREAAVSRPQVAPSP